MKSDYIYSDVNLELLYCINITLLKCIELGKESDKLVPENPELIKCFESLEKRKIDKHITIGLFNRHQTRGEKIYPRILKITINAYKEASEVKMKTRFTIPSPLYILYYALIIPNHPQTAAYSLASTRTLLLNLLEHNYKTKNKNDNSNGLINEISEDEISNKVAKRDKF